MPWISRKDRLPPTHDVVRVRRKNGNEVRAYFHADCMGTLAWYYPPGTCTYFQDFETLKFLKDVTHWEEL